MSMSMSTRIVFGEVCSKKTQMTHQYINNIRIKTVTTYMHYFSVIYTFLSIAENGLNSNLQLTGTSNCFLLLKYSNNCNYL